MKMLRAEVAAGRATLDTYDKLSKTAEAYNRKIRDFSQFAPPYNPNKVFEWCHKLEKHLSRYEWETIPNAEIKKMLLDCIEGEACQEIVLLQRISSFQVEFKNGMLLGLYNAELRKTCLMFMPKEIKHKREIKAVLDHQLMNLRTYNQDPRAPAQDMAGQRSTYGYE